MLQSPFKSMLARTAIFALLLALAISFFTVGLAPSATAQQANDDPCEADATTGDVTCSYDEGDDAPVANFSGMDPEGEMIVWSLAGPDAADFDIMGGVLSFKKIPNFETPSDREWDADGDGTTAADEGENDNSYQVMVVATEVREPGSLELAQSTDISVAVNVKNLEEPYSFTLNRRQVRAGSTATVTATLTDPDGPSADPQVIPVVTTTITPTTVQWYVPKVNRPDLENDDHWIAATGSGNATATYTTVAADAGKVLRVVATYTDGIGESEKAYAMSAYPVAAERTANTVPAFPASVPDPVAFTVRENAPTGTVVGSVRAADVDASDILSHELGGTNADLFDIDIATGRITVAGSINHEANATLAITVNAFDPSGGESGARTVNITVEDVNEAPGNATPTLAADATGYMVNENRAIDIDDPDAPTTVEGLIATFAVTDATDQDEGDTGATLKLSLGGPDVGDFKLGSGGELTFAAMPNYESPADADGNNKYQVSVITTDDEGLSSELALVITVENVDEVGEVTLSTGQPAIGQPITAMLDDPDMGENSIEWQWHRSDQPTSGFDPIQGATSDTYTPIMSVDDDPITTENEGVDGDEGMYLRVTVTYRDNQSADDVATTTHEEGRRGDELDDTGTATTVDPAAPDGDDPVAATSANAVREEPTVNQAPVFESGITREVPENTDAGGKVGGPVTATDPDGDALTYRITGGADMGAFEITAANRSSGQITVKKGTELNFEGSQTTYVVEVTADDPFGLSSSAMVTITVTDVNEPPEVMLQPGGTTQPDDETVGGRANVSVQEGTSTVGTYNTTITNPSWSLSGTDAGDFMISGGDLSFRSMPDYEAPADANTDNVYMVTVMASGGGNMAELDVTVTVTNDPSDDQTGGGTFDPLSYDTSNNGQIEKSEMIMAVNDYLFNDRITKAQMIQVINLYLFGS